ncbi:MAG: hypothetical protein OJF49_002655 [Ktedonobacterales bacterium]|jgi:outer membrane protein assembly factor BamB|nr:MAG: hypothetical protein OJF49_002655 [Ktedonobacterales bacterium]
MALVIEVLVLAGLGLLLAVALTFGARAAAARASKITYRVVALTLASASVLALLSVTGHVGWGNNDPQPRPAPVDAALNVFVTGSVCARNFLGVWQCDGASALHALRATDGSIRWRSAPANHPDIMLGAPLLANGVIYTYTSSATYSSDGARQNQQLVAARASDGTVLWHTTVPGLLDFNTQPAIFGGILYNFGYSNGSTNNSPTSVLSAVRATDGALLWHNSYPFNVYTFEVLGDTLYVISSENSTPQPTTQQTIWQSVALNISDGTMLRKTALLTTTLPAPVYPYATNQYVLHGDTLYTCEQDGNALATRIADGKPLWRYAPPTSSSDTTNTCTLTVTDDTVYVSSQPSDGLVALRAADGKLLWRFPKASVSIEGMRNGVVYVEVPGSACSNYPALAGNPPTDTLYALDTATGAIHWQRTLPCYTIQNFGPNRQNTNLITDDALYLGGRNTLYVFQASDGARLWQQAQANYVLTPEAEAQGVVFIQGIYSASGLSLGTARFNTITALRASDGAFYWQTRLLANGASTSVTAG